MSRTKITTSRTPRTKIASGVISGWSKHFHRYGRGGIQSLIVASKFLGEFNPPVTFTFTDIFYPLGQFDPIN